MRSARRPFQLPCWPLGVHIILTGASHRNGLCYTLAPSRLRCAHSSLTAPVRVLGRDQPRQGTFDVRLALGEGGEGKDGRGQEAGFAEGDRHVHARSEGPSCQRPTSPDDLFRAMKAGTLDPIEALGYE